VGRLSYRTGTAGSEAAAAAFRARDKARSLASPSVVLGLVMVAAAFVRALWLATPHGSLIGDENFYVNAARIIAGVQVPPGHPYAGAHLGLDPNIEHPPLGKLLIAGSIRLFGDNALGWRLPSLVAGMFAILLLYAIVRAAAADAWLGVLAASIFAFDNLALVHSRIATLDMPLVAFLLLAVWLWLHRWRLAAGAVLGIAALVKEVAIYGLAALVLIDLVTLGAGWLHERTLPKDLLRGLLTLLATFTFVSLGGLWLLDLAFSTYNTPWQHVHQMLHYGLSLQRSGGPAGEESRPWQWLANEVQMHYLRTVETISSGGHVTATRDLINFRGAMNPLVIGTAPIALGYSAWRAWRVRDRLSIWVVSWVACTYLALYPLVLFSNRTMYIFYFLVTLPAVAVAIAQLLLETALPRAATFVFSLVLLVTFLDYYPFRRIP
jgi:dolichyl-phosphate-mannose-protein mannosyltransferase